MPDLREMIAALSPTVPLPVGIDTRTTANGIDAAGDVLVYQPPDVLLFQGGGAGGPFLPLTGGQLTGPLLLAGDPVLPLGAATKSYVDAAVGIGGGPFLPLSGGVLTGQLTTPMLNLGAANGQGYGITVPGGLDLTTRYLFGNYYYSGTNTQVGNQNFSMLIVNDDVAFPGPGQSNAVFIQQNMNASATRAGGVWCEVLQTQAPIGEVSFITALTAAASASYNCGGTGFGSITSAVGAVTTLNTYTTANNGATFLNGLVGYELDMAAETGSSLGAKTGMLIALGPSDTVSGSYSIDSGISFTGYGINGWDYMLSFGSPGSQHPYKPTSTLLKTWAPQTPSRGQALATWGLDFFDTTFSGGFAKSQGFAVDGRGNITGQVINAGGFSIAPSCSALTIGLVGQVSSLISIAAGGNDWTVGDNATTASGGVYVVTSVTSGVVTGVTQLVPGVSSSPPSNPVAATTTAFGPPGFWRVAGSGLTLNLAWSGLPGTLSLMPSGGTTILGGELSFGAAVDAGPDNPSNHILLNTDGHGIGYTAGRINYIAPAGGMHAFRVSGLDHLTVTQSAVTIDLPLTVLNGQITWNRSGGQAEVAFVNEFTGASWAFAWWQTTTRIATLQDDGTFYLNGGLGVFGSASPLSRPNVTGSRGGNAALESLLTALAAYGLVTDISTP